MLRHIINRGIHTTSKIQRDISRIPLSEPLTISSVIKESSNNHDFKRESRVTRLSNGIRVCTEPSYGQFVTIGAGIESGCRFENGFPPGTSRIVEKLAFSSSLNFSDRDEILNIIQETSGIVDCQSTRDTFMYAASCHKNGVDKITQIISDSILKPIFTEGELEFAKKNIEFENLDLPEKIEAIEILLNDYIHQAAFQHNTLGYPKFNETSATDKVTLKDIYGYLSRVHTPERIVVGGIGVDHDEFVASVEKHFNVEQSTWKVLSDVVRPNVPELDQSLAQYTGGELRVERDLTKLTIGKPYPNLAHVVIGFEGCSYKDDDFVAFCVLQSLLGGGNAFSAGGPGKGMYSRMYSEVMYRHHWMYTAIANNYSYRDSGLFTVTGSCDPEAINHALIVLIHELLRIPQGADKQELERAKAQLKSQLMMNLEIRPVLFEDMVRQYLGHDERRSPEEYAEKIAKVTNKDIIRVAERMLSTKPSLVGYGDLRKLSKYNLVDQAIATRSVRKLYEEIS
ncbi:unnamed protein product [Caenorhabditis angaria]|uniref:Alpha-MPP n=1 Tax=Caenorhabditis angaria TaxID=860376 RepID=A0A9P1MS64_9PELO|nr:unnamed protein product [Caenorhabditis angaria]